MLSSIFSLLKIALKSDLFLPLFLLLSYIVFLIIARGVIPTSEELIATFSSLYATYGYEIIFAAAALEALILVNFFVPGQVAMAMGAIFASTGQIELTWVVIIASIGALFGYTLDYILGYFGFSDILKKTGYGGFIDTTKVQLKKFGNRGLILGFVHPTSASFLSLVAGTINIPFIKFIGIAAISTLVWMSIWGILFYIVGDVLLKIFTRYSFLVVILVIAGLFLVRLWKSSGSKK